MTTTVNVRRDASPPSVSGSPDRGPDANGWYNHGLNVGFSGVRRRLRHLVLLVRKLQRAGQGRRLGFRHVHERRRTDREHDVTRSSTTPRRRPVEAKAERQPDANGWYNHAVQVAFVGSDALSGVDSCAAPILYKGPDTEKTSLSGTCRDKASNTSQPSGLELKYDMTPPSLARVKFEINNRGIALRWTASKDSLTFAVVRRPGLKGPKPSTVYNGGARAFTDRRLARGVKYRYTVTAYDQAGNGAVKAFAAQASRSLTTPARATPTRSTPALASPALGARVSAPPLLAWKAVRQATYYNVQLFYEGRKILSVWPKGPQLRLQKSWKYGGKSFVLRPGRYRWLVWPGFDELSANHYGKLLGSRVFIVTAH